ncbi:MAG: N-acetyltransferase [Chloroflexota bacterium]
MVSIRFANTTDIPILLDIYNEARARLDCFQEQDISLKQFQNIIKGEKIHIAVVNDGTSTQNIAGFISVWVPQRFVHHLYIQPAYQNMGIATRLINTCAETYGLPLSLKSLVANTRACAFYERNGWVIQGEGKSENGPYYSYVLPEIKCRERPLWINSTMRMVHSRVK